jgi:pyruvate/2-oxoacid:ferredoxin oxidoreductase alpha subunit
LQVRLFRPWSAEHLLAGLPATAKRVAVLDRTKEAGSLGEPLYLDVAATLAKEAVCECTGCGKARLQQCVTGLCLQGCAKERMWRQQSSRADRACHACH